MKTMARILAAVVALLVAPPVFAQTAQQAVGVAGAAKDPITCNVGYPPTIARIQMCQTYLQNQGHGGKIIIPDSSPYGIPATSATGPITLTAGISFEGIAPSLQFSGNVPDSFWNIDPTKPGTVFVGDGSLPYVFVYNNSPQGSADGTNFATHAISGVNFEKLGFKNIGFRQTGATNVAGLMMGSVRDIYDYGPPQWAIQDTNFMHMDYTRIYVREAGLGCISLNADVSASAILIPGNSRDDQWFCIAPSNGDLRVQCYQFWAHGGTAASLNEIFGTRLQCNNFSRSAYSGTATITSGNVNIVVPDATKFAFGMPVYFLSACGNFSTGKYYVVLSVNTTNNTITLASQLAVAGPFTPTATCSPTIGTKGMPSFQIIGDNNSKGDFNISLQATDTEGIQSTPFYVEGAQGFVLSTDELPSQTSYFDAAVMLRHSFYNRIALSGTSGGGSLDIDSGSASTTSLTGNIYGFNGNGYCGVGIFANPNDNIGRECLTAGLSTDLEGRQLGSGTGFVYSQTGIGQKVSTYQTGALTLSVSNFGVVPFTGSSPVTWTLPTCAAPAEKTSLIGMEFDIVNAGSATLTVATDGAQVFNGIASKTSTTLPAGQELDVSCMQTGASTYGWRARLSPALN